MMSEVYKIKQHLKDLEVVKADLVNDNICVGCLGIAKDFKSDEAFIDFLYYSGFCQNCQDK